MTAKSMRCWRADSRQQDVSMEAPPSTMTLAIPWSLMTPAQTSKHQVQGAEDAKRKPPSWTRTEGIAQIDVGVTLSVCGSVAGQQHCT